jgi:hypothetical protein
MVASIENLDAYKSKYSFSTVLCGFVDENIEEFLSDESLDDAHVKEFLKMNIKDETIEIILKNHQMETFSENLNNYRDNVVRAMIRLKYFKYTRNKYNEVLSAFSSILPLFAECYWDEFEPEISSISFDLEILNIFIESDIDDEKKVVFLNRADASKMTDAMYSFVRNTNASIHKRYLQATWNEMEEKDRPEFMVKHFSEFTISEIQNMFAEMPEEYHALKQEYGWHEVLLEKNAINKSLCKKLLAANYISTYDKKKEKNILFTGDVEKLVARVKAKR